MHKEEFPIPPPLNEPGYLDKQLNEEPGKGSVRDSEEVQPHSRSSSLIMSDLVDNCIKEEDPVPEPTFELNAGVAEFAPSFVPSYSHNFYYPMPQDAYSQAYLMAKDQYGCRMLQQTLDEGGQLAFSSIFDQILYYIVELMDDPFGNYLCQKLFEMCDKHKLSLVLELAVPALVKLSRGPHGTRSVQKLIEMSSDSAAFIRKIGEELAKDVVELIQDVNGNHVIQKCLNQWSPPYNQFIYNAAEVDIVNLSTHRHGCCVLQRSINAASFEQKEALVNTIVKNTVVLVQDAYGNYVVQYVLDLNDSAVNARLAYIFMDNMGLLSVQKFSSNVIEKCIQQNSEEMQVQMIDVIARRENLCAMIVDQYANYGNLYTVVQRALKLATVEMQKNMLERLRPSLEELKRTQFGKKVYAKLASTYSWFFTKYSKH